MTPSSTTKLIQNIINNTPVPPVSQKYIPVLSPSTSKPIASVALSNQQDVETAVESSKAAFQKWSSLTTKSRTAILLKFHSLIQKHSQELASLIVQENGKNITEALADVAKGNETVEYACSLPQLSQGKRLHVSASSSLFGSPIYCHDTRKPLGVVASVVPFNFPFMVPMWTLPIALVMGNTVILKPSEKVPLTLYKTMELLKEAGVPDGVVNVVQGTKECVEALIDHEDVKAVTFVGSSPIAKLVKERCNALNKRCTALGGAKNHLVALSDCDVNDTARDVVVSSMGCAGQRCMAASVLLLVGENPQLLDKIVEKAQAIELGTTAGKLGPVIDEASYNKISKYVNEAEAMGAKILVDGRSWMKDKECDGGFYMGPTIILHSSKDDAAMKEEIFGPVLSIYQTSSWTDAIEIENSNPFGNAACVYTCNGGSAEWFLERFNASMLGVNIGIPVPREPFSFGGLYGTKSKYGDMDITGDGAMEFFSNRIKVTTKWIVPKVDGGEDENPVKKAKITDAANFAGTM